MERNVETFSLRRSLAATTALAGLVALGVLMLPGGARAGTIGTGTTAIAYSGAVVDYTIGSTGTYDITATGGGGRPTSACSPRVSTSTPSTGTRASSAG